MERREKTKEFLRAVEQKTEKFFYSIFFQIALALFVYLFWLLDWGIYGLSILLLTGGVIFAVCKDVTPIISIVFLCVQTLNATFYNGVALYCYAVSGCLLITGMAVHLIRFRPFKNYKLKGFTSACIFFGFAIALSGIGVKERNGLVIAAMIGLSLVFVAFALILSASIGKNKLADPIRSVCRVLIIAATLAAAQMFTALLKSGNIAELIATKMLQGGYANFNHYANLFGRAIPILIFLSARKNKFACLYLFAAAIFGVFILICSARASILMATIVTIPCLIYCGIKTEYKKQWLAVLISLVIVFAVFVGVFNAKLKEMLGELLRRGMDDTGRFEIWLFGWDNFKKHPIFGVGFDNNIGHSPGNDLSIAPYWYHNTLVQTIASMGLVGAIAFVAYIYCQYRSILTVRKRNEFALPMGASLLLIQLISLLDIHFYVPQDFIQMMALTMTAVALLRKEENNALILPFPVRFIKYAKGAKKSESRVA